MEMLAEGMRGTRVRVRIASGLPRDQKKINTQSNSELLTAKCSMDF